MRSEEDDGQHRLCGWFSLCLGFCLLMWLHFQESPTVTQRPGQKTSSLISDDQAKVGLTLNSPLYFTSVSACTLQLV